jgi:hypothetical protein
MPPSRRHHANGIALGDAWEVGSLIGPEVPAVPSPSGALGQLGDLGGRVVQDSSIEFGSAPGIGHMPHRGDLARCSVARQVPWAAMVSWASFRARLGPHAPLTPWAPPTYLRTRRPEGPKGGGR